MHLSSNSKVERGELSVTVPTQLTTIQKLIYMYLLLIKLQLLCAHVPRVKGLVCPSFIVIIHV